MEFKKGTLFLSKVSGYTVYHGSVGYKDIDGNHIVIQKTELARLYEGAKEQCERSGGNWKEHIDNLFAAEEALRMGK